MLQKIISTAKIKSCTVTADGAKVQLEEFDLTGDQYKRMSAFVKTEEEVYVIIKSTQGVLFENADNDDVDVETGEVG